MEAVRNALSGRDGVSVAAALVACVLLAWAARGLRRRWRRLRVARRMARAAHGERRAALWLTNMGFEILGAQVSVTHQVRIDQHVLEVALRADYLVARGGRRYVAEVKTGALAPRLDTAATRRQLLEYRVAFDVDGVLLVDAEAGRVHAITFPRITPRRPRAVLGWVAVVAWLAGSLVGLLRVT